VPAPGAVRAPKPGDAGSNPTGNNAARPLAAAAASKDGRPSNAQILAFLNNPETQRMLTAKDHVRSRLALILSGLADLPIVLCFLLVGILLWAFYQEPGKQHPFAHYILEQMPVGLRGLLTNPFGTASLHLMVKQLPPGPQSFIA